MGFMNAALGRRFFATFFFALLAGMHLSFRERLADPDPSAPRGITSTCEGRGQYFIGKPAQKQQKKMERNTGFEPATATLARGSSTGLSYFRSGGKLSDGTGES